MDLTLDLQLNFKIYLTLFFLCIGCGLKTKPKAPKGTALPSIVDQYKFKADQSKKKEEKKK